MVELRLKVGPKGQVLIPKVFRRKYGVKEGQSVHLEPTGDGLLIRGKPSSKETMERLTEHARKIRDLKLKGPHLDDLKKIYFEMEFEEQHT